VRHALPTLIHPMLATPIEKAFDGPEWLFEIKWDGYRAIAFIENGSVKLISRTQNDLTPRFSELHNLANFVRAKTAILDGEIVALDANGRSSFSLMQQRTGIRKAGKVGRADGNITVLYYAFDLLYAEGYDLRRVGLEERKRALAQVVHVAGPLRLSDHFDQGIQLFDAAKQQGLEGILAKRRAGAYVGGRSRDWLKIKVTQTVDCVIGGYTDPEGSRAHFGAVVLGLYDKKKRLVHVGQAGTGFDHAKLREMSKLFATRETSTSPFSGPVEARHVHWLEPSLVAEIKFTEWTHETAGGGLKLRAPVFMRLRDDKKPEQCTFAGQS
jgi:bifunctional non-homologous end joining protein LigD